MSLKRILLFFSCFSLIFYIQATTKVACVGNSVTYGMTLQNQAEESYPALLQEMLGEAYKVRNFGKSGATLLNKGHRPYTKEPEYQAAIDFQANIVVIHLGLNDTDPRNWPNYKDEFVGDYLQLIADFQKANNKAQVYVCRMTPIFDWHRRYQSGTYTWYNQIQEAIEKVAELADLPLIDLNEELAMRSDLLPDALHPNKQGAEIIAKRVYASLTGDFGGLQLAEVFSDGMVLQREQELTISGIANAEEQVVLEFASKRYKTKSNFQGKWSIKLPPLSANKVGQDLKLTSQGKSIIFKDVVVGEVWLCSGQSNMAFPFRASAEFAEKRNSINPNIRIFDMQPIAETNNVTWDDDILKQVNNLQYFKPTHWKSVAKQEALNNFSAVAIAFGNVLADSLDIPIGLIHNAVGGSPQEAWIARPALEEDPALIDILADFYNNDRIQDWCRGRAKTNVGDKSVREQRHPYQPSYLYESGILPLKQFPIKGVIWYQGESNAHNVELYELLFHTFVENWRKEWKSDLPLIFAQLSSIDRPSWPYFRNSQRQLAEEIPNVYMAVTSDLGDSLDVHPRQKYPIGERMAASALANVYQYALPFSAPSFKSYSIKGKKLVIEFDYAEGLQAADRKEIIGFEISGKDGRFYPAAAKVKGNSITLHSPKVKEPQTARYAWAPFTRANLVNSAGFPASSFETRRSFE